MKSFALWIERDDKEAGTGEEVKSSVEINFNYLTDCMNMDDHDPALDIGIKYEYKEEMKNICIYIPFLIRREDIADLGKCLSDNKEILNSIFNENYTTHNVETINFCNVMDKGVVVFSVYALDIQHDLQITNDFEGTIIKIKAKKPEEDCAFKIYYRFRIETAALKEMKNVYTPTNNVLSSSFERYSYVDFRFNDYRTLDTGLIEEMQKKTNVSIFIEKFHFLLITKAQIQVMASEEYTERSLNKELWNAYYQDFGQENLIVANHWHKKAKEKEIKEVSLLIKFHENVCTNRTIAVYVLILFALTVLFNSISTWVWELWLRGWLGL